MFHLVLYKKALQSKLLEEEKTKPISGSRTRQWLTVGRALHIHWWGQCENNIFHGDSRVQSLRVSPLKSGWINLCSWKPMGCITAVAVTVCRSMAESLGAFLQVQQLHIAPKHRLLHQQPIPMGKGEKKLEQSAAPPRVQWKKGGCARLSKTPWNEESPSWLIPSKRCLRSMGNHRERAKSWGRLFSLSDFLLWHWGYWREVSMDGTCWLVKLQADDLSPPHSLVCLH